MVIPSSDEEMSYVGGGGWKLVPPMGSGANPQGYGQGGGGGGGFMALGAGKKEKDKEREKGREGTEKMRARTIRRRTIDRSGTLLFYFLHHHAIFFLLIRDPYSFMLVGQILYQMIYRESNGKKLRTVSAVLVLAVRESRAAGHFHRAPRQRLVLVRLMRRRIPR